MSEIKLRFETETIHTLYYNDLESFVSKVYGINKYSFVATEECGNDSSHRFNISSKEEADADADCTNFTNENIYNISNYNIFCKLIADGHLEPGNYLVRVCW